MKTITKTAIVALLTTGIGLSAIAPSYAQTAAPAQEQAFRHGGPGFALHQNERAGPGRGGPLDFLAGDSEAVEIALVRLSHAIEMTAAQQALFDTLRTDALAASAAFSTAIEGLRPAAPAEGQAAEPPALSEMLATRIAVQKAQLAALEAVQPALTAFFDSLTDEQTAQLTPQRPERGGMFGKGEPRGQGHHGQPGPQHGAPGAQAPAPAPAPANG